MSDAKETMIESVVFAPAAVAAAAAAADSRAGPANTKGVGTRRGPRDFAPEVLRRSNHDTLGFAWTVPHEMRGGINTGLSLTVRWRSSLWMAPLELRFRPPSAGRAPFKRRLVVQLPSTPASQPPSKGGSGGAGSADSKKKLKAIFDAYDHSGDGAIDMGEISAVLQKIGLQL
eukprot:1123546-Prymnesium_polylepis.1